MLRISLELQSPLHHCSLCPVALISNVKHCYVEKYYDIFVMICHMPSPPVQKTIIYSSDVFLKSQ